MPTNPQLIDTVAASDNSLNTTRSMNTSASTLTDDLLVLVWLAGQHNPPYTLTTPSGWTSNGTPFSVNFGKFGIFFKYATSDGSESVSLDTSGDTYCLATIYTIRNAKTGLASLSTANSSVNSSTAWTIGAASPSFPTYSAVLLSALSYDLTLRTWSTTPSMGTEVAFAYASNFGQLFCYFDHEDATQTLYQASKTGGAAIGGAFAIYVPAVDVTLGTLSPTTATVGSPYSGSITGTSGGTSPYTYTLNAGVLPLGLTLNSSTGEITGTPVYGGLFTFQITVVDSVGKTTASNPTPFYINVSGTEAESTGPVASHVFGFDVVYRSTYQGAGAWSSATTISPSPVGGATFSSPVLEAGDGSRMGMVVTADDTGNLTFVGDGPPDSPTEIACAALGTIVNGSDFYWDTNRGSWYINGRYYVLTRTSSTWAILSHVDPFAGTDWTWEDSGNSPVYSVISSQIGYDPSTNKLYLFTSEDSGTTYKFFQYNFATDTWDAPFGDLTPGSVMDFTNIASNVTNGPMRFSNGDFGIIYTATNLYLRVWSSGGGWAAAYQIAATQNYGNFILDTIDPTLLHVFGWRNTAGGKTGYYNTITRTGTANASIYTFSERGQTDGFGHGRIKNETIYIPFNDYSHMSNDVWVSPQTSAAATALTTQFGTAVAIGDFVETLPPRPDEVGPSTSPSCAYMVYEFGAVLTLACPVANTGTVGTPYTGTLTPTGGTEPYTFSITAGSLPPGLSLNTSTGVISGTPTTQGTYIYTAQVTDADSNTATADCSITISAGPPPEVCETAPAPAYNPTLAIYPSPMEQTGS